MRLSEEFESYQLLNEEIQNFGWPAEIVDGVRDSKLKLESLTEEKAKVEAELKGEDDKERRRALKARLVDVEIEAECAAVSLTKFKSRMDELMAHKRALIQRRDLLAKRLYEAPNVAPQVGLQYSSIELARLESDELARQLFNQEHNATNVSGRVYREHHAKRAAELRQELERAKAAEQRLSNSVSEGA